VHEWLVRTDPAYMRRQVALRDHGVCARCGRDMLAVEAEARRLGAAARTVAITGEQRQAARDAERAFLERHGMPWYWSHAWEAHHKVAVAEGGGECGLDGYETLCLACHRAETAALAARRASKGAEASEGVAALQDEPLSRGG
jgi:hypothetical protein